MNNWKAEGSVEEYKQRLATWKPQVEAVKSFLQVKGDSVNIEQDRRDPLRSRLQKKILFSVPQTSAHCVL